MKYDLFFAAALLLAACQGEAGNQQTAAGAYESAAATANASDAASASLLQPGEWESRIDSIHRKFEPVETPQGRLALDDDKPSPPPPYKLCVTEEKSKQLFKKYRTGGAAGESCSQASFTMQDGRILGTLVCTVQGEKSESKLDGRYTTTSYEATEVTKTRIQTPAGHEIAPTSVPMTTTRQMTARRIGDCPPG